MIEKARCMCPGDFSTPEESIFSKNIEISNFKYEYDGMWVNIQKANEYNPPHNHAGHISFVIYLKIDK